MTIKGANIRKKVYLCNNVKDTCTYTDTVHIVSRSNPHIFLVKHCDNTISKIVECTLILKCAN